MAAFRFVDVAFGLPRFFGAGGDFSARYCDEFAFRYEHRRRRRCFGQDIERRRQDEVYLDALGAPRIPGPTTAGDFCRRFDESAIEALQAAINETRVRVWRTQPAVFFDEAFIDADGTLADTTASARKGCEVEADTPLGRLPEWPTRAAARPAASAVSCSKRLRRCLLRETTRDVVKHKQPPSNRAKRQTKPYETTLGL